MVSASNNGGGEQRREGRASSSSSRRVVLENLQMAFHYSTFKTQRRTLLSALTTFFVLFLLGRIRRLEQKASATGLEKQVGKLMTCMSFWPQADIKAIRPENTHVITKRASTKNALPREYIVRPHFFLSQTENFISFLLFFSIAIRSFSSGRGRSSTARVGPGFGYTRGCRQPGSSTWTRNTRGGSGYSGGGRGGWPDAALAVT